MGCTNLIENYIKKEELDWYMCLADSMINIDIIPNDVKIKIDFICKKMNFVYKDDLYSKNPFQPMFVSAYGNRTANIEDLTKEDVHMIKSLINYTNDPILLGKIYDILWIIEDNDAEALEASGVYFQYYINNLLKKDNYQLIAPLKRSLYILCYLRKDMLLKTNIEQLFNIKNFKEEDDKRIVMYYVADLISQYRQSILANFVPKFEHILSENKSVDDISLSLIKILIDYYKSIKDLNNVELWQIKYAAMCEDIEKIRAPYGHEYLSMAINMLDPHKHEQKINELMLKKDASQKKMFNSFRMREVSVKNEKIDKGVNSVREKVSKHLNQLNSIQQFMYLLKDFNLPVKSDIQKQILGNKNQSGLSSLFTDVVFGEDKTIIYDSSKASKEEKEEYEFANYYRMRNHIIYVLLLQPYMLNNKVDVDFENLIDEIVSHNLFVPKNRREKIKKDILNILNRNIRTGLSDLIIQFEYGCRYYLVEYKKIHPTVRRGSKYDEISLDGILIEKYKVNKFRTAICEVLGEGITLALEYLTCRPLSANLRNRYVHDGYGSSEEFTVEEVVLAYLLIKTYCLGFDPDIN